MGEEKPDEELMGKRKSSPRLSTTSCDADELIMSGLLENIHHQAIEYLRHSFERLRANQFLIRAALL
jgi:hypothetical protein